MEKELREAVKEAARKYYRGVYGTKKEFTYIPPSGKLLDEEDLMGMIDASLDMWLTAGRFNDQFEKDFASLFGCKICPFHQLGLVGQFAGALGADVL